MGTCSWAGLPPSAPTPKALVHPLLVLSTPPRFSAICIRNGGGEEEKEEEERGIGTEGGREEKRKMYLHKIFRVACVVLRICSTSHHFCNANGSTDSLLGVT